MTRNEYARFIGHSHLYICCTLSEQQFCKAFLLITLKIHFDSHLVKKWNNTICIYWMMILFIIKKENSFLKYCSYVRFCFYAGFYKPKYWYLQIILLVLKTQGNYSYAAIFNFLLSFLMPFISVKSKFIFLYGN